MYLERRLKRSILAPVKRSLIRSGKGQRKLGLFTSAFAMRAPSITGTRPRLTVSTSGNSGNLHPRSLH
jgi:hypothetical protein